MKVNGIPTRTIRALDNGSAIEIIDQTLLPYRFEKRILSDWRDGGLPFTPLYHFY